MEIVGLNLVEFESLLPSVVLDALQFAVDDASPATEVMDAAPYLLHPLPGGMGCERELRVGLLRSVCFTATGTNGRLGHAAPPVTGSGVVVSVGHHPAETTLYYPQQDTGSTRGSKVENQRKAESDEKT
jgi:hypothetical protein